MGAYTSVGTKFDPHPLYDRARAKVLWLFLICSIITILFCLQNWELGRMYTKWATEGHIRVSFRSLYAEDGAGKQLSKFFILYWWYWLILWPRVCSSHQCTPVQIFSLLMCKSPHCIQLVLAARQFAQLQNASKMHCWWVEAQSIREWKCKTSHWSNRGCWDIEVLMDHTEEFAL